MKPSHLRVKRTRPPRAKVPPRLLARAQVGPAVRAMAAPSGVARFKAGKQVMHAAERDPARVYPHLDALAALLAGDSKVMRWNALQILARLAAVDSTHALDGVLETYLDFIPGPDLVSAANAIQGAVRIAQARPDLLARIVPAILKVEQATYRTAECRNVAIGHTLDALGVLWPTVRSRPDVAAFVRRQQHNPRPAAARRAAGLAAELP